MSTTDPTLPNLTPPKSKRRLVKRLVLLAATALALMVVLVVVVQFPYDVDGPLEAAEAESVRKYYTEAYQKPVAENEGVSEYESRYTEIARYAAESFHIEERVKEFVKRHDLEKRPVLEIGSGRGYLQDVAEGYTGLDISSNVRRFYHKKFVLGSATSLPFPDDSFDGAWSIWVLEHVPNPEQALRELRRVMRNDGIVFLLPAWNCASWAAEGYHVRPYSDFGLSGKLIKASIPLRSSPPYKVVATIPSRIIRNLAYQLGGPTRLHYRRLTPNYEKYWGPDGDAVNCIDRHEMMLWFKSRGDECLDCLGFSGSIVMRASDMPLIVRIHKKLAATAGIRGGPSRKNSAMAPAAVSRRTRPA
jgi:SAM-dependent methyltransferase